MLRGSDVLIITEEEAIDLLELLYLFPQPVNDKKHKKYLTTYLNFRNSLRDFIGRE